MRVLLVDDEDDGLAVAIARCLLVSGQATVRCLTNAGTSPMLRSRRCPTRRADLGTADALLTALREHTAAHPVDVVIPIQERLISLVGGLRPELAGLEGVGAVAPLTDPVMFERVDHKWHSHEMLEPAGIRVPRTVRAGDEDLRAALGSWEGPVLRKPSLGWGGIGIRMFDGPDDVVRDIEADPPDTPDGEIVQEYIPGTDVDCSFLSDDGRIVALTVQRSAMKQRAQFASALQLEFLHDRRVSELAEAFAAVTGWSGVAHLDLRMDARTGEPVLIEVNPRYWATLLGSLAMGVNFPLLHADLALGRPTPPVTSRTGLWLNHHAVVHDPRNIGLLAARPRTWMTSVDARTIAADLQLEAVLAGRVLRRAVSVTAGRLRGGHAADRSPAASGSAAE